MKLIISIEIPEERIVETARSQGVSVEDYKKEAVQMAEAFKKELEHEIITPGTIIKVEVVDETPNQN